MVDNSDTDTADPQSLDTWPRFIVIEFTDESAAKPSPFAIDGIAGTVIKVNIMKSGNFLVECAKKAQADNLQHASMLAGVGMKASPHGTLSSSRGVI
jgi:nucleoid-associated protein YgaU